jgi:hypothetical protein
MYAIQPTFGVLAGHLDHTFPLLLHFTAYHLVLSGAIIPIHINVPFVGSHRF